MSAPARSVAARTAPTGGGGRDRARRAPRLGPPTRDGTNSSGSSRAGRTGRAGGRRRSGGSPGWRRPSWRRRDRDGPASLGRRRRPGPDRGELGGEGRGQGAEGRAAGEVEGQVGRLDAGQAGPVGGAAQRR